ncbi:MAG: SemiSWEET transporter [Crenarchaeota archaeon]|nr:SemiSWEET transporter [Thermoproteota archaeon]
MIRSSLETYITIIGLVAATLSSGSLFPQLLKVYRTKSTKDISVRMYALLTAGIFIWLIYGLLLGDIPIILANFIGFIQALSIYILKMKYK